MATNHNFLRHLLLLFLFAPVYSGASSVDQQECILLTAEKHLQVKEATGNNDGPEVEKFLLSVGLGKGYSWCAAFVHYVLEQCGVPNTINAWSPSAHNAGNLVYFKGKRYKPVQTGDVFTIWSTSKKRIAHTGFFIQEKNARFYQTIEGNTNDGGSFNGDGVYRRVRSYNQTYSITRWTK